MVGAAGLLGRKQGDISCSTWPITKYGIFTYFAAIDEQMESGGNCRIF